MTHLNTTLRITRKKTQCNGCLRCFPQGTLMLKETYADNIGREIWDWNICATCNAVIQTWPSEDSEEILHGDVRYSENWGEIRRRVEGDEPWTDDELELALSKLKQQLQDKTWFLNAAIQNNHIELIIERSYKPYELFSIPFTVGGVIVKQKRVRAKVKLYA